MAKIRDSDAEARLALDTLFKHLDLDNVRDARLAHCIVLSVGRSYLRFWAGHDAVGTISFDGQDERPFFIDGYDLIRRCVVPDLKWRQRAKWYELTHGLDIHHVVDWLSAAVHNNERWLSNTDDRGRPKKLMKCGDIIALSNEADKCMRRALTGTRRRKALPETDERVVVTLGDLSLVRLLTPKALDAESAAMRHCIGLGAYDVRLSLPGLRYYSVRDDRNKPLATVEVMDGVIIQCSGPRNSFTTSSALDFLYAIRMSLGWISRDEHMTYVRRRHELSPQDVDRIGTVVDRGQLTSEERRAVIEERKLQLQDREYAVDDDHLDNILGLPPRP